MGKRTKKHIKASPGVVEQHITPATYRRTDVDWSDRRSSVGKNITADNLMAQAAVYQAVYVLSSGVASVDFRVIEYLPSGGTRIDYEHPYYELMAVEPNPYMAARTMRESIMIHLLTHGNAYVFIERNYYGEIIAFHLLNPVQVRPAWDDDGNLIYWIGGKAYPDSEIVHIAAPGTNGIQGLSPLHHLRNLVGVASALDEYQASFFSNGCNVKGVLQSPTELSSEAQSNLRKSFEAVHSGAENGHKLMILEDGVKFQPTSSTPNESQMTEASKAQILKIAMAFNLPPTKFGIYDNTALNTLEESNLDLFNSSYLPWIDRIGQAFNRKCFNRKERKRWGIEHDDSAQMKGRMADRVDVWERLKNMGVLDVNDIRAELGMPPKKYGDVTLVEANNLKPLEQVVNPQEDNING